MENLDRKLADIKLNDGSDKQKESVKIHQKSSNIFIKKKFNSLSQNRRPTSKGSKVFDKNAFFSDSPMAVDDKRWGQKINLYRSTEEHQPQKIESPVITEKRNQTDHRSDVNFVHSNFAKYSSKENPFSDPYSSLNDNSKRREGEKFLDENSDDFNDASKAAQQLLKTIGDIDDEKEKQLEAITDKDRKVDGLEVNLLDHQVHGLRFLLERENLTSSFKGGLLCDDMGLGKTVQSIALIVKGRADSKSLNSLEDIAKIKSFKSVPQRKFKTTLVICPVSLGTQWQHEIKRFAPHLKTLLFHGPSRTKDYKVLSAYDVVISSYGTIRSENNKESGSPIYEGYWHRIILDEAHNIRNLKAKITTAVCEIASIRRWCLTGTPVQNSIDELQSLLFFLQVSELSNTNIWKNKIGSLLKRKRSAEAFRLVKSELEIVMLRRTKAILKTTSFQLPEKRIHHVGVEFSESEQRLYAELKSTFSSTLATKLEGSKKESESEIRPSTERNDHQSFYFKALLSLLRLRQMCCHWKLLERAHETSISQQPTNKKSLSKVAVTSSQQFSDFDQNLDELTDFMSSLSVKEIKCSVCFENKVLIGENVCSNCATRLNEIKQTESAKVHKVIEILMKDKQRKTIIFSQFRSLLLLLGPILERFGFKYVMYDGTLNVKQKNDALEELKNNPETTILLCSLKSGAVGLNLTVASQVILYDPWWNPQIEEQAIDRIYRIGQTRDVDIHKLFVKDTVEIGIIQLQDRKRALAKAITDGSSQSLAKIMQNLSQSDLIKLFGLKD